MNISSMLARNAFKYPAKEALVCGVRRQNWQQLYRRVERLAGAMARSGVQKGDKVELHENNLGG